MTWDIALDLETGDFMFGPTRDLLGVTGPEIDKQRINIRARIPKGTFMYDVEGTLGSNLHLVPRNPSAQAMATAKSYLLEAIEPAAGINVVSIEQEIMEDGKLFSRVNFIQTETLDDDESIGVGEEGELPTYDASIVTASELE